MQWALKQKKSSHANWRPHNITVDLYPRNHKLQDRGQTHCAIYENEKQRLWPLNQKGREAKIAQFAKEYGFRLRHYKKHCA
jgi:hypothetical protein